jgi:hypothetical protein
MEKRLEIEVPEQDTSAVAEMQKRGLKVVPVSAADAAHFRSTAEEFASSLSGVRIPAEILTLPARSGDARSAARQARQHAPVRGRSRTTVTRLREGAAYSRAAVVSWQERWTRRRFREWGPRSGGPPRREPSPRPPR